MNTLLIGRQRAGKSYQGCRLILDALKEARVVVTNLAVKEKEIAKLGLPGLLVYLDDEELLASGEFFYQYPGAFFVIDECKRYLPAGLMQKDLPKAWAALLSEQGHVEDWRGRTSELILIAQDAMMLPKCARTLIDETHVYRKLRSVGLSKWYTCTVYEGPQSLGEERATDALSSHKGKYTNNVGKYYRSHSKTGRDGLSIEASRNTTAWGGIVGYVGFMALISVGALYWLATNPVVGGLFDSSEAVSDGAGRGVADGGQGASGRRVSEPVTASVAPAAAPARREDSAPTERRAPPERVSGYWSIGHRCGAIGADGRRWMGNSMRECQTLEGRRTQPPDTAAEGKKGESWMGLAGR